MEKDLLQICLITYNRKNKLDITLKEIFSKNSPIKNYDIAILDNCSTDGSSELIEDYCTKYPNLKHIRHSTNIGGNANIIRAFEYALKSKKKYFWVLCDDDKLNFSKWYSVEEILKKDVDAVVVERKFVLREKTLTEDVLNTASFIPGLIYKTSNLTSQVIQNMYNNVYTGFPHLMLICSLVNNNKTFAIAPKIVKQYIKLEFKRGCNSEIHFRQKAMNLFTGMINSYQNIKNKEIRVKCCSNLCIQQRFYKSMIAACKATYINCYNLFDMLFGLNFIQKLQFILAFIITKLSFKNYKYWDIQDKEEWLEYLTKINQQKYIDKLAKKLKNKKVVVYGAGLISDIIFNNYDLSKLNIYAIADKKFKNNNENWYGYKTLSPEIAFKEAEIFLVGLKEYNFFEYKCRVKKKLKIKIYPLIERNFFYPIASLKDYNKTLSNLKRYYILEKYKKYENRKVSILDNNKLIGEIFNFS